MTVQERKAHTHPLAAGFTVKGEILNCWERLGAEQGVLGAPIAEQALDKNGAGQQRFQGGCICYSPETGAHPVTGKFYLYWADCLGTRSPYGYPLEAAVQQNGRLVQRFQGGVLDSSDPRIRDGADLRGEIARREIGVRNQGPRGTCSVQVMVFLLEHQYTGLFGRDWRHLSVEYANHFANVATGDRHDGHCFDAIEAAYCQYGTVPESLWPYNKDWVYDYEQGQRFAEEELTARGRLALSQGMRLRGRFLKPLDGTVGLTDGQMEEIIALLDAGVPVGVGRQHSLSLVGYRREEGQPGGGYFIFRNSYGTSPDFTGYQTESFESVQKTVNDVYVYQK